MDCMYLRLNKAFDKVSHRRLVWKLDHLGGVFVKLIDWMQYFYHERQMSTLIRGKHYTWRRVTSGVPQVSVLVPIMFTILINDLWSNISAGNYLNKIADDAKKKTTSHANAPKVTSRTYSRGVVLGEWNSTPINAT